jgi:hypothetical protein
MTRRGRVIAVPAGEAPEWVPRRARLPDLPCAQRPARQWWRANAPHLFRSRRYFMFQQDECHVIEERPR